MFEIKVPNLLTELEKETFWTSHPAGFPSFLFRFSLVKVGYYFNEIDQEWREVWMYHNPTEDECLLDSDVNLFFSFQAREWASPSPSFPAPQTE